MSSVSPGCAVNSVTHGQLRVVGALGRRNIFRLRGRLILPVFYRHVTIVSDTATTKCNSFYGRLTSGSCNLRFAAHLFPTAVRNRKIRRDVVTTLSDVGTRCRRFSYMIVVHNNNTADSLSNFSALTLTRGITGFPLPVVANVKRRESRDMLSVVSFRQIGAPATTTTFLVGRLTRICTQIVSTRRAVIRGIGRQLRIRGVEVRELDDAVPIRFSLIGAGRKTCLSHLVAHVAAGLRSGISSTRHHLRVLSRGVRPMLRHGVLGRGRQLRLLRRHVRTRSPSLLLGHNCDVALGSNGDVHSTSRLGTNSVVRAEFTRNGVGSRIGWFPVHPRTVKVSRAP